MLKLIEFLSTGCFHKWIQIDGGPLYAEQDHKMPIGIWYDCRCSKCGSIKRFETGV